MKICATLAILGKWIKMERGSVCNKGHLANFLGRE